MDRSFNEFFLRDIVLCDPITRGGQEALTRLRLNEIITVPFFYEKLHITSKYDEEKECLFDSVYDAKEDNCLYYRYTSTKAQFAEVQSRITRFNDRFSSDSPNEYPLLILGVAGNGKTIEVNWRIYNHLRITNEKYCHTYIDLENSFTKKTHEVTFECPNNSAPWLFFIKLLEETFKTINDNSEFCNNIYLNFQNTIRKMSFANNAQKTVFERIKKFKKDNAKSVGDLFNALIELSDKEDVLRSIKNLLEILMWVVYCLDPTEKHYIIIDNIEQYVVLNNSNIQIFDFDISLIYRAINEVVINLTNDFNDIEKNLGWKAFKIIVVLRRTSLGLLDAAFLQAPVKVAQNTTDITGYFQINEIWEKKKKHIWEEILKERYDNEYNNRVIRIFDIIMQDGFNAIGTGYQRLIAPLMSYGIRRNTNSQVHAAFSTYNLLSSSNETTIDYDVFIEVIEKANYENANKYMFRRALMEIQFKWSISTTKKERWEKLNIGHLSDEKEVLFEGQRIKTELVKYENKKYITILRRVLSFLSFFSEDGGAFQEPNKTADELFSTCSLYDLMKGLFVNSAKSDMSIKEDEYYLQLAKVLIALSNMSFTDTRCAPFVILNINNKNFHQIPDEKCLEGILRNIWNCGENSSSSPEGEYNCSQFGIRLTEAGYSFLLDWQPSFSFIASLYCFTIPPLFFLKDVSSIKYVINTVYNESKKLCKFYDDEALRFNGHNNLKTGTYLPMFKGKYKSFKERVKELHVDHLTLYRSFLKANYVSLGISNYDLTLLTDKNGGYIENYLEKYREL